MLILSGLVWLPSLGALVVALWPGAHARSLALGIAGLNLLLTILVLEHFDPGLAGMQISEQWAWIDALDLTYHLGIDGLSLPLVILNSCLGCIAIYSSDREIPRPRLYYPLLLSLMGFVAGAFLAQNLLLFFLFYELELIPLYLLIAIWGGERRGYAAMKFLIYTAVSGVLVLAAFLGLAWLSGTGSFTYAVLLKHPLPLAAQLVLLSLLLVGFGIKIPLVPFHTWLPDAHVEASTPVSVLLAGVLLKLGTYGLMRFGWGLFGDAWRVVAPGLALWAVVGVLYGSLTAIAQTDMKKMVAYSSIGHMGYILLALAAATPVSLIGTVFQMVSHGLISAQLFLLVGVVYQKTGTRDLGVLRGLLNPERGLPIVGSLMVLGVMASAGIPGMAGFVSEFLVFRGSIAQFPWQTILCILGTGLTSVYFLLLINRAFFGRLPQNWGVLPESTWSERIPALILGLIIVILGVQPGLLVHWSEATLVLPPAALSTLSSFSPWL